MDDLNIGINTKFENNIRADTIAAEISSAGKDERDDMLEHVKNNTSSEIYDLVVEKLAFKDKMAKMTTSEVLERMEKFHSNLIMK